MPGLRLFAILLTASLAAAAAFAAGPAAALERAAERGDQTVVRSLIQQDFATAFRIVDKTLVGRGVVVRQRDEP